MITENKVAETFCIADDFCKEFDAEMAKNMIGPASGAGKRRRKRMMPRRFVALTMFLRLCCFGRCTGISFVTSPASL